MSLRDRVTPPSRRPRPEPLSPQAISRQSRSRAGRRIAEARGFEVEWVEADAEAMPFADNGFDVVMSCVGAMFAPDHQATADELIRLCRPGGTIGMINWTPDGFIGSMFATIKP
jgi:ubiquinone/menaquinone biosynthesis C-methylase UbiE